MNKKNTRSSVGDHALGAYKIFSKYQHFLTFLTHIMRIRGHEIVVFRKLLYVLNGWSLRKHQFKVIATRATFLEDVSGVFNVNFEQIFAQRSNALTLFQVDNKISETTPLHWCGEYSKTFSLKLNLCSSK